MTTGDFMSRLTQRVAGFFPVIESETFEQYIARARAEHYNRRVLIAAALGAASKEIASERQSAKKIWIASARLRFWPGERQHCAICGKYKSLTEAHHIVPLALQFEAGAIDAIQEFRWLCPTHHAAEHVIIIAMMNEKQPDLEGTPIEELDALTFAPAARRFAELFYELPRAHSMSKSFLAAAAFLRWSSE